MPTYEYACEACGYEFEKEQRISEDPIKKCPKCGKSKARRLITQGSFILKGGGWYSDLYSSAAPSAAPKEASKAPQSDKKSKTSAKAAKKSSD